jgi:hypothetical protein
MNPNQEQEKKPLEQYVRHNESSKFLVFFWLIYCYFKGIDLTAMAEQGKLGLCHNHKAYMSKKNVLEISNRNFNI